jgi:hypothetical protein
MPLLSHVTGGRRLAARYMRAIQTRRQEASEPTSHRPRHAMGCRPSDLIHIQQVRGDLAPKASQQAIDSDPTHAASAAAPHLSTLPQPQAT